MDTREYRHTEETPYHISAGGVPYRLNEAGDIEVVILANHTLEGRLKYSLPKGTLHHNETLENCARREVLEESGCETEIKALLGGMTRYYQDGYDGLMVDKTIIYFAMQILQQASEHDNEYEIVETIRINEAIEKLRETNPEKEEYKIVARLKEFLENN